MTKNLNRQNDVDMLVAAMFDEPFRYRSVVEKVISRNKKLSSKIRRELTGFAYGAFKWRNRLWDDKPKQVDFEEIQAKIEIFQNESLADTLIHVKKLSSIAEQAKYISYPVWLFEKWIENYGFEKAVEVAWIQNHESPLCIRCNGTEENFKKLPKALEDEGVETRQGEVPGAFYIPKKANVRGLQAFKKGMFEIQDEHSQQVCVWTNPRSRDFIVDGCARTGGKALHLAALQKNEGRIMCMDVDARVFDELENRAKRLGIKTIETFWLAKDDPSPRGDLKEKADIVFVDAPCSGTGTIRHNPSVKWALQMDQVIEFQKTQMEILRRHSRWVKPKATLIYVTCSTLQQENEDVVNAFVKEKPEFVIIEKKNLLPKMEGGDGFFFTKMQRRSA